MSDNKKYYYMRLKDNFFDSEEMKVMEGMPDGYLYSNILLKLYLISLKSEGRLMLNNIIPYNAQMLASITRHQVGTVEKALEVFTALGLIEILDNGAIYMLNIQNFIGQASTEADRVREYQRKISAEKKDNVEIYKKSTPEIEIDIEKKIDIEKDVVVDSDSDTIKPYFQPTVEQMDEIVSLWNQQQCTADVRRIKPLGKRWNNTVLCIENDLDAFLNTIRDIDNQEFFQMLYKKNAPVTYDWFTDPDNYEKVIDGNYRYEHREKTFAERLLEME